jgi:mono/diheme cytochrome c family protein
MIFFIPAAIWGADPPESLFIKNCASCHGKDGKGKTPIGRKLGAKDLTMIKSTAEQIEKQIAQGMKDKSGTVKMPSFGGKLSPGEITALRDYVLKFRR